MADLPAIWHHWPTRFITYFSFALNYHWAGGNVCGYHILSLLLHVASSILVWRFMLLTLNAPSIRTTSIASLRPWIAFFCAAIFLTHPLQTQAVNYIVQRAVLLAAFFYLAALVLYIKANLAWRAKGAFPRGQLYYLGALVCAFLSVLSKEHAVSLPFMICVYQWFFFPDRKVFPWRRILPFFAVILIIPLAWHPFLSMGIKKTVEDFGQGMSVQSYVLTQSKVILTYLKLLVVPFHQRVEYDYSSVSSFWDPLVLCSVFSIMLLLGLAVVMRNNFRLMAFGIFWFLITLMPESSFWPINDLIFEHRLYLPLLGFSIFLTSGIFTLFQAKRASLSIQIFFY